MAVLLALAFLVVIALAAFRPGGRPAIGASASAPASASRLLPPPPPRGLVVAAYGPLHIFTPINETVVTAIGYHGAGDDALPLDPVGRQANEGLFSRFFHRIFGGGGGGVAYYQLGGGGGPSTGALDIGAAPGTDVYAPVDGTVVGLRDLVLDGKRYGSVIDIQPSGEPSVVVSLSHLNPDPALTVGSQLAKSTSKIGTVVDTSAAERLALARYTQDKGNYIEITAHAASTAPLR